MSAHLYIIRGVPGSGKSSLARSMLRAGMVSTAREADHYMTGPDGTYQFDPRRLRKCHLECLTAVSFDLEDGHSVAVANTFTEMWEMEPYIKLGYPFTVITCERRFQNTHGVPDWKVADMRKRFEPFDEFAEAAE